MSGDSGAERTGAFPLQGEGSSGSSAARKIGVIGGGWAGCAAAVELAAAGCNVTLFEAARTLGGRARPVEIDGRLLDNGQHILLGAYAETLRLMQMVGIDEQRALLRLPLQMRYPRDTGMEFVAPRLPAPWHVLAALLRARGLPRADKLALARFSGTMRWIDWRLNIDMTVAELLERHDQTPNLVRLLWRPLCIAALNTPPERASAQVFLNVLRDSLGAKRAASDMLLPRVDLGALFPQQAAAFVAARGGSVCTGKAVRALHFAHRRWHTALESGDGYDGIVLALPPAQAAILLDGLCPTETLHALAFEPITTCYLQYMPDVRLDRPFYALADDSTRGHWGQFVFDRGLLDGAHPGLLAVVVSVSQAALSEGHDALAAGIAAQLAAAFGRPELARPNWQKVISEKRATFSCTPALARPGNATGCTGLVLAGDYTAGDYPATLEGAVRSGVQAARLLLG